MQQHHVRVYASKEKLPKEEQLAWKMAELAAHNTSYESDTLEMVGNRIIDNAAVAIAAINRAPIKAARAQALAHPRKDGATLFGMPHDQTFECEWAAWANGVAVRELDMHDTFLAADYSHPGDTIPAIIAVAQQTNKSGKDILPAILTAYEIQMNLVKNICLHEFKKDHIAHLAPAIAAGLGTLLKLDTETIFHAIGQSVHLSFSTRQARKGEISSWKAFAPAFAAKLAIEATDRAMRGEKSPTPIYEGEDSVIAWMLGGKKTCYAVFLPETGESCRTILESYTKEHSAEYQSQALIDMAFRLHERKLNFSEINEVVIRTSHHTHYVIGTGSGDPQKFDPDATRETLDHSAMYILAVAWEDGTWHHIKSYTSERAHRQSTAQLWKKIRTEESEEWTKAYHDADPSKKKFGAEIIVTMNDGTKITERLENANAHVNGARPFRRPEYIHKFTTITEGLLEKKETDRFLTLLNSLEKLSADDLKKLLPVLPHGKLETATRDQRGIF
ncbi:MAG: 2-methylcitrate dehydratase [Deltaproteobacteria bacterium RIFCSPLOWO2_02_FULL_44_10]|nr:MAG: 2-methylcitrate dehydratase [Deltaproteobacteria bacterium RIFCSPHIGHO2_02_FULL_44_16]OGQ46439.1 MAG: 2-methylcitrate dehydratase [Deltaproteobacteria bacterium RIFCSPLOWO2_02_FULL_44_10]